MNKIIKPIEDQTGLDKYSRKKAAKDRTKVITTLYLSKKSIFIIEANSLNRSLLVDDLLKEFILKNNLKLK